MTCKFCKIKPVWTFTNKDKICKKCFIRYFEKKVLGTIRKYNMPIQEIKKQNLKANIINNLTQRLPQRKGKLSEENLDNISLKIIYEIIYGKKENLKKFIPSNQPLYFLSNKEVLLYSKLKKIKGKVKEEKGKSVKINHFISSFEQKNPDIRQNIVQALLKFESSS